jgi:NAD(P)H dehydrogenase (quinone)
MEHVTRIVIVGGGPGGDEAALVAARLGAEVTVVDCDGLGGASVLTDCVPSKTLIATAEVMTTFGSSYEELGIIVADDTPPQERAARVVGVDLGKVNRRVKRLALAQSHDIAGSVTRAGVRLMRGRGRLVPAQEPDGSRRVVVRAADGTEETLHADAVLVATGAHPREIADARPDGERILNWKQVYDLDELPKELIVVGSGVTGAEFAGAYQALGSKVTLVSSRDRVLPGEDPDAAAVLEDVFRRRGMNVMARSRAMAVKRVGDRVEVVLTDGRVIGGTHCLMAVGSIPNTADMGLAESGVRLTQSGHIKTDKVSRTGAPGVYAAGDCTGVLALASVAAMQGRIAMYHFLGDAVAPLNLKTVSANVFTDPEIATVGYSQADMDAGRIDARVVKLPLLRNPRAKMQGIRDGFVKIFCRPGTGIVVGGVVVAPRASELIHPLSIAVDNNLTVEQVANTFTVYPSLSGSIAEVARQLHTRKTGAEGG